MRSGTLSPRDPVRVEWAPEAAVEFSSSLQKQAGAAKAAVALNANGSALVQPACSTSQAILEKRRKHVGPNLALFFQEEPLHIVRGQGCELFDPEVRPGRMEEATVCGQACGNQSACICCWLAPRPAHASHHFRTASPLLHGRATAT